MLYDLSEYYTQSNLIFSASPNIRCTRGKRQKWGLVGMQEQLDPIDPIYKDTYAIVISECFLLSYAIDRANSITARYAVRSKHYRHLNLSKAVKYALDWYKSQLISEIAFFFLSENRAH